MKKIILKNWSTFILLTLFEVSLARAYEFNPCAGADVTTFPERAKEVLVKLQESRLDELINRVLVASLISRIEGINWTSECSVKNEVPIVQGDQANLSAPRNSLSYDGSTNTINNHVGRSQVRAQSLFSLLLTHEIVQLSPIQIQDKQYQFVLLLQLLVESQSDPNLKPFQDLFLLEIKNILDVSSEIVTADPRRLLRSSGGTSIGNGGDIDELTTKYEILKLWFRAYGTNQLPFNVDQFKKASTILIYQQFEYCLTYDLTNQTRDGDYRNLNCQDYAMEIRATRSNKRLALIFDRKENFGLRGSDQQLLNYLIYYIQLSLSLPVTNAHPEILMRLTEDDVRSFAGGVKH